MNYVITVTGIYYGEKEGTVTIQEDAPYLKGLHLYKHALKAGIKEWRMAYPGHDATRFIVDFYKDFPTYALPADIPWSVGRTGPG